METRRPALSAVTVGAVVLILALSPEMAVASGGWMDAHATFYGDESGAETMRRSLLGLIPGQTYPASLQARSPDAAPPLGPIVAAAPPLAPSPPRLEGACGYGNLFEQGYGLDTTALSVALFSDGWSCGGCYEIQCQGDPHCKPGGVPVKVTATNLCPANYSKPYENWCNPPLKHFDLSKPMFLRLVTDFHVGIIPVQYRRVPCAKRGGIRIEMTGNQYWVGVLVFNVAGPGEVKALAVKGTKDGQWRNMKRNWGQVWDGDVQNLVGQGLSFRVVAGDGRSVILDGVVPASWTIGQSFQGKRQF